MSRRGEPIVGVRFLAGVTRGYYLHIIVIHGPSGGVYQTSRLIANADT